MKYVLQKDPQDLRKMAIDAVKHAKSLMNDKGDVQFSVEHFGDCKDNIGFVIDTLQEIVEAGATTINLPNTVERTRPFEFTSLVRQVYDALPKHVTIAVHCHDDLGMATATTVESYFVGARQLECSLNGLGERAGNTNLYEAAVALYNNGVNVPLNLHKIYETAMIVSEMSHIPIPIQAPLIGPDALAHRSGIHQDGAAKTKGMKKGAYRPIQPSLIGRDDDEKLAFTSQSGKTAVYEIISKAGYPISMQEAIRITPKSRLRNNLKSGLPDIYAGSYQNYTENKRNSGTGRRAADKKYHRYLLQRNIQSQRRIQPHRIRKSQRFKIQTQIQLSFKRI